MARLLRNRIVQFLLALLVVGVVLYLLGVRMTKDDLFISAKAEPLFCIGGKLVGETCEGGIPFTNSLLMTLVVDAILLALAFGVGSRLKLIPTGLQNVVEAVIEAFYNFALGVDRRNVAKFFPLPATIFLFFLIGNLLALVPGSGSIGFCVEHHGAAAVAMVTSPQGGVGAALAPAAEGEIQPSLFRGWPGDCPKGAGNVLIPWFRAPAADLNVTLAVALVAVFMIEFYGFQALGIGYLGKFFNFREGFIPALVGIIELISEVMRIIAFAFRIFGNIFGGEVVLVVMMFLFPYVVPLPFYGLEVFVAFIQAVIFAVLTLVFFSLAVQAHGHDSHGHPEPVEEADSVARALP
jgi:F-type H+-transporting ATPase subunit a